MRFFSIYVVFDVELGFFSAEFSIRFFLMVDSTNDKSINLRINGFITVVTANRIKREEK